MPGLPGHLLQRPVVERAALHQPLAGREGRRLVVGLHGHFEQLVPIRDPPQSVQGDLDAPRPTRDAAQHAVARQPLQGGAGDRFELRGPGHGGQLAFFGQHVQRRDRGRRVGRLDEGVAHGGDGLRAGVVPGVAGAAGVLQKGDQGGEVGHPFDGGAAHAGVWVAAGDFEQQAVVVRGQIAHRGGPHRGVVTLPGRLRAEAFEQLHAADR